MLMHIFAFSFLCVGMAQDDLEKDKKLNKPSSNKSESINLFGIQVLPESRKLVVPVKVNMTRGPIEYILVHDTGKTHESLFKTSVKAEHLNAALLLLLPKKRLPSVRSLHENQIFVQASYKDLSGNERIINVDRWVKNSVLEKAMKPGPWGYLGSRMEGNVFVASRDGSFIAVREDADTIIGNPRPESVQDDIWQANVPMDIETEQKLNLLLTVNTLNKE